MTVPLMVLAVALCHRRLYGVPQFWEAPIISMNSLLPVLGGGADLPSPAGISILTQAWARGEAGGTSATFRTFHDGGLCGLAPHRDWDRLSFYVKTQHS